MNKDLENAIRAVQKQYGKGAVFQLGSSDKLDVDVFSTGISEIDEITGIGGFPRGRIVEIFGPESGGKTTLTLHVIASAQQLGGVCAYIDAEHALDPTYARALQVNIDELLVSQPSCGEEALEIAETLIKSGQIAVVVVDSVAALVPKAELEGDMGAPQMGLQARLMSQALRKLAAVTQQTNTCLIFVNQIRDKIGVLFGNPETTAGGRALKFYSSLRVDIRRTKTIKEDDAAIGSEVKVKIVKNKLAAPFREVTLPLTFGRGFLGELDA